MLAVGGSLLAGAIAANAAREITANYYNDDVNCFHGTLTRGQRCGSALGRAQIEGILALAGYAGAAVSLATSTYLFVSVPRETRSDSWSVSVQGRF
jgi:hypothetical protein